MNVSQNREDMYDFERLRKRYEEPLMCCVGILSDHDVCGAPVRLNLKKKSNHIKFIE